MNRPAESKAEALAKRGERALRGYLQRHRTLSAKDKAHDCEHGHQDCAAEPDGPCCNEVCSLLPDDE